MNYTLNQLNIFVKIVQTKSLTKAAEELHLTQPAVSIQLKNFQNQFEIPLTEVVGRRIFITDFGKEIAQSAESIINQVYAINYKTLAYKGQLTGRLKISVVSTGKYVMPYFLSSFINENTGIELLMDVTNKNKVIKSLENNEVDFALVSILPNDINIEKLDLLQNKLYLVGNNKIDIINTEDLEKLPFIFREEGSGTRQIMEAFIASKELKVLKKINGEKCSKMGSRTESYSKLWDISSEPNFKKEMLKIVKEVDNGKRSKTEKLKIERLMSESSRLQDIFNKKFRNITFIMENLK